MKKKPKKIDWTGTIFRPTVRWTVLKAYNKNMKIRSYRTSIFQNQLDHVRGHPDERSQSKNQFPKKRSYCGTAFENFKLIWSYLTLTELDQAET